MLQRRSKTDRLDATLLADLLRINQLPLAHIPSGRHQWLRDITRHRRRLVHGQVEVKNLLRWLPAKHNIEALYKYPFGTRGLYWFGRQNFGFADNQIRDELMERLAHYVKQIDHLDEQLAQLKTQFPEAEH